MLLSLQMEQALSSTARFPLWGAGSIALLAIFCLPAKSECILLCCQVRGCPLCSSQSCR